MSIIWYQPQHFDVSQVLPAAAQWRDLDPDSRFRSWPPVCPRDCSSAVLHFTFPAVKGGVVNYRFCEQLGVPQREALDAGSMLISSCVYSVRSPPAVSTNLIKALLLGVGDLWFFCCCYFYCWFSASPLVLIIKVTALELVRQSSTAEAEKYWEDRL